MRTLLLTLLPIVILSCSTSSVEYEKGVEHWRNAYNAREKNDLLIAFEEYGKAHYYMSQCGCSKELANVKKNIASTFSDINSPEKAIIFYDQALEINIDDDTRNDILYHKSKALRLNGQFQESMELLTSIYDESSDKLKLNIRNRIGVNFFYMGLYEKSSENYWRLINESKGTEWQEYYTGKAYFNLASNFHKQKDYERALEFYGKSNDVSGYIDSSKMRTIYTDIGESLLESSQPDEALTNFYKALTFQTDMSQLVQNHSNIYYLISKAYFTIGDVSRGIEYANLYASETDKFNSIRKDIDFKSQQLASTILYDHFQHEIDDQSVRNNNYLLLIISMILLATTLIGLGSILKGKVREAKRKNRLLAKKAEVISTLPHPGT